VKSLPHTSFKEQLKTENYVNTELKKSLWNERMLGHFCLASGRTSALVAQT